MRCPYNRSNFLQNPNKRYPIAYPLGRGMECLFMGSNFNLYSDSITAAMFAISCYIGLFYNGTRLYSSRISKFPFEIPHELSSPHIERCICYTDVKELSDLGAHKCIWESPGLLLFTFWPSCCFAMWMRVILLVWCKEGLCACLIHVLMVVVLFFYEMILFSMVGITWWDFAMALYSILNYSVTQPI